MLSTTMSTITPSYTPTPTPKRNRWQISNYTSTIFYYNMLKSPLPENPFGFDDGLILLTEEDLQEMELPQLGEYSSTLSTSISLQTSTLLQNQLFEGIYEWLAQKSQTAIDDLDTEIATDTGLISVYQEYQDKFDYESTMFISTLAQYDIEILEKITEISYVTSSLSSYSCEYDIVYSSILIEDTQFISSATQYSTFYWTYLGYQDLYDLDVIKLGEINRALSTAREAEEESYKRFISTGNTWSNVGNTLSTLYINRKDINSTVTQYRINEQNSLINYTSSIDGMSTLSSIYSASVTNERYAISLSTLTQKINDHSDALDIFNKADLLYSQSIPSQGAAASAASGPTGNSALWAARSMAWSALQLAQASRDAAESATKGLLDEAGLANILAYEQMLLGYDNSIISYLRAEQTFLGYKQSSLRAVALFSTIYDESSNDVNRYTAELKSWSTLYESSLVGASTLLGLSEDDYITIERDYLAYMALSRTISSLTSNYKLYSAQYESSMKLSTLYAAEYYSTMSNIDIYTEYYNSTNSNVLNLSNELDGPNGLVNIYYTTLFTNSSLTNYDIISQADYTAQVYDLINQEELSMYQYREGFCLSKRIVYQTEYDRKILAAVTAAQATVAPGVSPPVIDLSIPDINSSYQRLVSINSFLGLFSNIYDEFDIQAGNIVNLSTSIGNEGAAWSTVDFYTKAQFYKTPIINNLQDLINASCSLLTSNQIATSNLFVTYALEQPKINSQKRGIIDGLSNFFPSTVIAQQDKEISSFILMGEKDAASILDTQPNYTAPSGDMFVLNLATVPITGTSGAI